MRYPLELPLAPSRRMFLLIGAIHAVAAIAFLCSSFSRPARLAALTLIVASACVALRAERLKRGCSIRLEDSGAFAVGRGDDLRPVALLPGCTDFGWAVWLQWHANGEEEGGGRGAMMLVPDNLPPERWRSLRIWLRHKAAGAAMDAAGKDASG